MGTPLDEQREAQATAMDMDALAALIETARTTHAWPSDKQEEIRSVPLVCGGTFVSPSRYIPFPKQLAEHVELAEVELEVHVPVAAERLSRRREASIREVEAMERAMFQQPGEEPLDVGCIT